MNGQGAIVRAAGLRPEVVSSTAVQLALQGYESLEFAVGDTYEDQGHTFYLCTFPSGNTTWCMDTNLPPAMAWHERATWIAESARYDAWRPAFHAFAFGQHRMLDRTGGQIYQMSSTVYTDVLDSTGTARPIRRLRRAPALVYRNDRLFYPGFELDIEVGVGLTGTGQGSNPQVMMRFSNDSGRTWSNEQLRSFGKIGEYNTRVWVRVSE